MESQQNIIMSFWNHDLRILQALVIRIYSNSSYGHYLHKQPSKVFYKKDALWNFAKFTGKQNLYQNLLFNKVAGWGLK